MSRYSTKESRVLYRRPSLSVRTMFAATVCVFTCLCTAISSGHTDDDWFRQGRRELRRAIRTTRRHNTNLAKNIILFVGDGMGISTVTAARIRAGQLRGESGEENLLFFENFPHVGFMKTYNADAQVPDSAGTGTAIMTGVKVNTGVIGCDSRVKKGNCSAYGEDIKLKTILHAFIHEGLSTGVVSNSRVTHATPASAFAHIPHRGWEGDVDMAAAGQDCSSVDDIAKQLVRNNKDIKVILGGGRRYFLDNTTLDPETGVVDPYQRRDGINLIEEWKADKRLKNASHAFIWNNQQFQDLDPDRTDYLLGLFSPSHMDFEMSPPHSEGEGEEEEEVNNQTEPSLLDMTDKAIRVLQRDTRGYFLMVEGSRIDWGHHSNSAYTALHETIAFDEAVERACQLTSRRDTLVIVTADHSHAFSIQGYAPRGHDILGLSDPSSDHATLDNLPYTTLGYTNGPVFNRHDLTNVDTKSPSYRQAGCIPTSVETHAGEDVGAYAAGPMSHLLHSTHEQNYLYHLMEYAACVGRSKQYCLHSKDHTRH